MDRDTETMCLEIPAQPALVGVARNVVTAVAQSSTGADPERLEDLRLAVSEACTTAVEAQRNGGSVILRCLDSPGRLEVRVEYDDPPAGDHEIDSPLRAWSLPLMEALVDEVEITTAVGRTTVRLVVADVSR